MAKKKQVKEPVKEIPLPPKKFSQTNKWFEFDNRIINLNHISYVEMRMCPPSTDNEVVEKPYRVIAFMNGPSFPCWDFKTIEEAREWIADLWERLSED